MSDVICLIPARGGSRRIPRKNLVDLCGRPLIAWTIECALRADVGPVWVSTEDEEIAEVARKWGAEVHERAAEAAADAASATKVLHDFRLNNGTQWLVYLQPTAPLRTEATVTMLARYAANGVPAVTTTKRCFHGWDRVDRASIGKVSWVHQACEYVENGVGYAVKGEFSSCRNKAIPLLTEPWEAIDIDHPWDLAAAESAMRARGMV